MSTKTTFKRIALVTVAAMGFGLLSIAPSTAVTQSDTLALSSSATSIDSGATASTTITQSFLGVAADSMTVTVSLVSSPTGNTAVPTLTAQLGNSVNGLASATGLVGTMADSTTNSTTVYVGVTGKWTLAMPALSISGTYVIKVTPANLTAAPILATSASAVTWTVTVAATAVADTTSTSIIAPGVVTVGSTADQAVLVAATGSAIATIKVTPLAASAATTGSTTISVALTGPGTVSLPVTSAGLVASTGVKTSSLATSAGPFWVYVYGDGSSGASTITITMGTVVLTETINTYGASASVTSKVVKSVIAVGSTASAGVISATVKDAAGNTIPGVTVYAQSGTTTVFANASATTGSTGIALFDLTALVAGTSSFVVANVATGSTATYSAAAVSVRAGSDVAKAVTMTLDKATYTPGQLATITVVINDADGKAVADGTYAAFAAAVTSTRSLAAGTLPTASLTTGSSTGTLTFSVNVPTTGGAFTLSALGGAGLAAAQAGLAISATATVGLSDAEAAAADAVAAAADAAAEATDAANAATDAGNAAAEAADAATAAAQDAADAANAATAAAQEASDAVAALSVQVASLIAGLQAQLRSLTNLIIRMQKKLNAIKR